MRVLEFQNLDLIEPFPSNQIHRLRGWLYCYKNILIDDFVGKSDAEIEDFLRQVIVDPNTRSWGLIDKNNITNSKHEAPLVGFIAYNKTTPYNGVFHVASSRTCWGKGLMDEAGKELLKMVFEEDPTLLRCSAVILDKNKPARAYAQRLGFQYEGKLHDWAIQNGQPITVVTYGFTRPQLEEPSWVESEKA